MPRKGSVPRHCDYCGVVFFTWPYLLRSGKRRLCTLAHALAGRTMPSGPAHVQWTGGRRVEPHGYVQATSPAYLLTLLSRGTRAAAQAGEIGQELVDSFDREARRRVANGSFYGAMLFLSLAARKDAE